MRYQDKITTQKYEPLVQLTQHTNNNNTAFRLHRAALLAQTIFALIVNILQCQILSTVCTYTIFCSATAENERKRK